MARTKLRKPILAQKLRYIREAMQLSQNQMINKMGLAGQLLREEISDFERNKRIPPLEVILQYSRVANITVESLIDDDLELPEELPSATRHEGIKRKSIFKNKNPDK